MLAGCGEDQVAIRGAGIWARRLARAPLPRDAARAVGAARDACWSPAGPGRSAGTWPAGWPAAARPRVVLASRSGPAAPGAAALAARLAAAGTAVEVIACDAADRAEVAGLLARIAAAGPPLTAVLHTAGAGAGHARWTTTTAAELAAVLAAKAAGAAHLDELTAGLDLDAFVLFSSVAATWGSGRQPGYAAANAFLDALAEHRRARGLAATSVAWGPWGGGGMAGAEGGGAAARGAGCG